MCVGQLACMPWFYIGMRMEAEGRTDEAIQAYRFSAEAARVPNPTSPAAGLSTGSAS